MSQETIKLIQKRLKIIEDLKAELNTKQEMVKDVLENDSDYQEKLEKHDKAKKERDVRKQEILNQTNIAVINEEILETRKEINENKEVLSEELMVLYATEGVTQITDLEGNTREFKVSVRLK